MSPTFLTASAALFVPVAAYVSYTDVRYRRIPNLCVLFTLAAGLLLNTIYGGPRGLLLSVAGCAAAFALMFLLRLFGGMGAGDVKFFAAVGALVGLPAVMTSFVAVSITGLVLAVVSVLLAGTARETLGNLFQFLPAIFRLAPLPRFESPDGRRNTVPYGVAIAVGSLVALFVTRA